MTLSSRQSFLLSTAAHRQIQLGGMKIVRLRIGDVRLLGNVYATTILRKNWIDSKFYAALFKRAVAIAKDKHNSDLHSRLSKPDKRSALYRFLRNKKSTQVPAYSHSVVLSPKETTDLLEGIAKGLEARFASSCLRPVTFKSATSDFREVTMAELADVILTVNRATPGPD